MGIEKALGFTTGVVATEHFFTFSLSSLPTTKQFFSDTEEHKNDVRKAYTIAAGLSVGTAILTSTILKDWTALFTAVFFSILFIILYEQALNGTVGVT